MASPKFRTEFDPRYGEAVELAPNIARITANNPSAFTFHGTNTYLLGDKSIAIIDPGPPDEAHLDAILRAVDGRSVSHIIVTHTHMDHSPLARPLTELTGAPILAEGPHRPARPLELGEQNPLDASADSEFMPDQALSHGDQIDGDGWSLTALFTPGHTANHMAFALNGTDHLFPGDHVMSWATTIVAPPDGTMADYMKSLDVLLSTEQSTYFPGHGGRLENAHAFMRALRAHRKMREQAVLDQIKKGRSTIPEMVAVIYRNTDKRLHGAAGLSVLAHIEDLLTREVIVSNGPAAMDSVYEPV